MEQKMTEQEKREYFRKTADDPRVRAEFAASRAAVVEPEIETQSTIRSIFAVEYVDSGAQIRYDIPFDDIDLVLLMPKVGGTPMVQMEGAEMYLDTDALHGGVEYHEKVARDGRFQVAERATTMAAAKFVAMEESCGWALIKTHAAALVAGQKVTAFKADGTAGAGNGSDGFLNLYTLNEVITKGDELGAGGRQVTDIYVSPRRFNDLRSQLTATALPEAMRERLWNGGRGDANPADELRIHKVYNRLLVTDAKGYAFTRKQGVRYGVMPIRQRLRSRDNWLSALERKIGTLYDEEVGWGVLDSLGLIEISF